MISIVLSAFFLVSSLSYRISLWRLNKILLSVSNYGEISKEELYGKEVVSEEKKHRRIRYSGKYPKRFDEKYKEIRGDEEIIEKVLNKGGTPAGQHVPVMLNECINFLGLSDTYKENKSHIAVDCTLGYGGHSLQILKLIVPRNGSLYCIDQDNVEVVKTEARLRRFFDVTLSSPEKRALAHNALHVSHSNFEHLEPLLKANGVHGSVTCLLADLGCSSMQIDDPSRGFTYKTSGYLDMRMNTDSNMTAATLLASISEKELCRILAENSDEEHASAVARQLLRSPIPTTTVELADRVRAAYAEACPSDSVSRDTLNSAVARSMQALRIEVNNEFGALETLLNAIPRILAPGGRVVILTFHSGEDRRVKKAFKSGFNNGLYEEWGREVVRASAEERRANPRAKCAKLR